MTRIHWTRTGLSVPDYIRLSSHGLGDIRLSSSSEHVPDIVLGSHRLRLSSTVGRSVGRRLIKRGWVLKWLRSLWPPRDPRMIAWDRRPVCSEILHSPPSLIRSYRRGSRTRAKTKNWTRDLGGPTERPSEAVWLATRGSGAQRLISAVQRANRCHDTRTLRAKLSSSSTTGLCTLTTPAAASEAVWGDTGGMNGRTEAAKNSRWLHCTIYHFVFF